MEQLTFWTGGETRPRLQVRDLPATERPLNRLREAGPGAVSNTELLACLLQSPDALRQAQELLARFEGLPGLVRACDAELMQVDGIGPAQAARIRAALEFGRRLSACTAEGRYQVRSPGDAAQILMADMGHLEQEHLRELLLDTRNHVLAAHTIYVGSLNASYVRVAEVFREPIRRQAAGIILAHNHPSGDPSPSPEDIAVTREIVKAGRLLSIEVLDHLVIGAGRWVSLRERGLGFES